MPAFLTEREAAVRCRRMPTAAACAAATVLAAWSLGADDRVTSASSASLEEARNEFVEAMARTQTDGSHRDDGSADSERLQSYPLYPYLTATRISRALAAASDAGTPSDFAAHEFLVRHEGEPVARIVRDAWLESLARRELWRAFLDQLDEHAGPGDDAMRCRALQARIALDDIVGLAPEVVEVWLTGRQLPLECEPVFAWLREQGPLTDDLIEQRVLLLLENGQAAFSRVVARRLPPERAAPLERWADLIERPRETLDRLLARPETLPDGALAAGWSRLTRNEPSEALARFADVVRHFGLDMRDQSRYALALALGLAWDRRAEALDLFAQVSAEDLDDYALTWLTRAALWAGEWRLARDAITAMSAEQRESSRWRYWEARTAEETGERREARELYRSTLPSDNYYAAMAAARLGDPMEPSNDPLQADEDRLAGIAAEPPFVRARELLQTRMPWHAVSEWRHGSAALDEADGRQTIHLAARWGWYDRAVATATSHGIFFDYELLYPTPYRDAVAAASALTALEPPLIYAVIRQESLYRSEAASAAGAIGLAQLQPDTARRAARRWGRPEPSYADLLVPEVNVTLGAAELRTLVETFDGQLPVALAAYNAGPNAARRWLPDAPLDADVWVENIPYNETRDYVQRVLWHSVVFGWLADDRRARNTRAWLMSIARSEQSGPQIQIPDTAAAAADFARGTGQ